MLTYTTILFLSVSLSVSNRENVEYTFALFHIHTHTHIDRPKQTIFMYTTHNHIRKRHEHGRNIHRKMKYYEDIFSFSIWLFTALTLEIEPMDFLLAFKEFSIEFFFMCSSYSQLDKNSLRFGMIA